MCKRMTYAFKKNLKIAFGRRIAKIFSALIKFKEKKTWGRRNKTLNCELSMCDWKHDSWIVMIPSQAVKVIVMPKIFITHQDLKVSQEEKEILEPQWKKLWMWDISGRFSDSWRDLIDGRLTLPRAKNNIM